MKTQAEKALAAVVEYDRLMNAISNCRKSIGSYECNREVDGGLGWYMPAGMQTHIAEVLAGYDDDGCFAPENRHYRPDEAMEIISDCEGCRKVFEAIQERKRLKKSLGAVKRTLRAIARAAKKGGEA